MQKAKHRISFTGDVLLNTQEEVVDFGANNYAQITGNLEIGQTASANVTDLTPLLSLTIVGGNLGVSGRFINLNGLNNLTAINGTLTVANNLYITNIDELSNVSTIGKSIYFMSNQTLLNVDGLIGIKTVNGQLYLTRNRELTNIDGFRNITSIKDSLYFFDNLLTNIDGLKSLTTIGIACEINRHFNLINIDGLRNLTSVGENLKLHNNQSLTSIDGLSNLNSVGGNLQVTANTLVDRFCGLFSLLNGGGLVGTYTLFGNLANPTKVEIVAGGACTTVAVEENFSLPTDFELNQNYPNPFNPITTISYQIPDHTSASSISGGNDKPNVTLSLSADKAGGGEESLIQIKIYDALGKEITTLVNEQQSPGNYKVEFDGSRLSSGIYFYQLKTDKFIETKKMLLMR